MERERYGMDIETIECSEVAWNSSSASCACQRYFFVLTVCAILLCSSSPKKANQCSLLDFQCTLAELVKLCVILLC